MLKSKKVGDSLLLWEVNPVIEALVCFAAWTEYAAPKSVGVMFFELPQSEQARIDLENPDDFVCIRGNTGQCEILLFGRPSENLIRKAFDRRTANNVSVRPAGEGYIEAPKGLFVNTVA